ncbi:MAG: NAD-dependent epimerase/dehydratase family protein [Gemmatimonadales bacterium]
MTDPRFVAGYRGRVALVLGGTGFLGRWIARLLVASGARVHLTARGSAVFGDAPVIPHPIDAGDDAAIRALLAEVRPAIVFNAIGYGVDPDEKREANPTLAARLNTALPPALATALIAVPGDPDWPGVRLVHVGSILEYGPIGGHLAETSVARPVGLYPESKLAGAQALERVAKAGGLRAVTARVPQLYGPGEHAGRLLPMLAEAAVTGQLPSLSQGTQPKDFLYVADAAEGLLRLGLTAPGPGEIVNLATGQLTTVRDFTLLAAHVLRLPQGLLRFERPVPPSEIVHDPIATDRLRELTGWTPPTTVALGIERTFGPDGCLSLIRPGSEV